MTLELLLSTKFLVPLILIALGGSYAWDYRTKIKGALSGLVPRSTSTPSTAQVVSQDAAIDAVQTIDAFLKDVPEAQKSLDDLWMQIRKQRGVK